MAYTSKAHAGVRRFGRSVPLVVALLMLLGLFAQVGCSGGDSSKTTAKKSKGTSVSEGDAANFKLKSLDGETVELKSLRGKVVVIDFWATWCPPCKITLPLLNKVYKETRGKDVEVFGISTDRMSSAKVKKFIKKNNISMPILHDTDGAVSKKYGVRGIPTMFIIDQDGNIQDKHVGADRSLDKKVLKKIKELLKK